MEESKRDLFLQAEKERNLKSALIYFKEYEETQKPSDYDYVLKAMVQMDLCMFQESIEQLERVRERNDKNKNFININIGEAYNRWGKQQEALDVLNSIEDPQSLAPKTKQKFFRQRGTAYLEIKQFEKASNDFEKYLENSPGDKNLIEQLCQAYRSMPLDKVERKHQKVDKIDEKDANKYYQKAALYHSQKKFQEEVMEFSNAIKLEPDNQNKNFSFGIALLQQKKLDQAEQMFEKYLELRGNDENSKLLIGKARVFGSKDETSYQELKKVKESPKNIEAFLYRAKAYNSVGYWKRARDDFQKVEKLCSDAPQNKDLKKQALNGLGILYINIGYFQNAFTYCTRALQIDPKFKDALFNCGFAKLRESERMEEAKKAQERQKRFEAKESKKNRARNERYSLKISCTPIKEDLVSEQNDHIPEEKSQIDFLKEAIQYFTRAIQLDKENVEKKVYIARGQAYLKQKQFQRAEKDIQQALRLDIADKDAILFKGILLYQRGDCKKAINWLKKIQKDEEYQLQVYEKIGDSFRKEGEYQEALKNFNKVIELDENNQEALCKRGFIYLKLGKYENAILDFSTSYNLDENAAARYGWGKAHEQLNQLDIAKKFYQDGLRIQPGNIFCLFSLAYLELDKKSESNDKSYGQQIAQLEEPNVDRQKFGLASEQTDRIKKRIDEYKKLLRVQREKCETQIEIQYMKSNLQYKTIFSNTSAAPCCVNLEKVSKEEFQEEQIPSKQKQSQRRRKYESFKSRWKMTVQIE